MNNLELKSNLYEYVKSEKHVILRDMIRNKRYFQKVKREEIESILNELEKEGKIRQRTYSGMRFLIFMK